jgi:hypothetical protein
MKNELRVLATFSFSLLSSAQSGTKANEVCLSLSDVEKILASKPS